MRPSLFSQSLFALPLEEAIGAAARLGFSTIEIACTPPHFDIDTAHNRGHEVAQHVRDAGLEVSALSLFSQLTDPAIFDEQVDASETFIRLAPVFGAKVVKCTPGKPGSAECEEEHWNLLSHALSRLVPVAQAVGVHLAFETHMRQLTDTLASSLRFIELAGNDIVGLAVDYSNLAFAGENPMEAARALLPHTFHTHVKNGTIGADGSWNFGPLDEGLTYYPPILRLLRDAGYTGALSIECLGHDAQDHPVETAARDFAILKQWLAELEK